MMTPSSALRWFAAMLAPLLAVACIATHADAPAQRDADQGKAASGASLPISAAVGDAAPAGRWNSPTPHGTQAKRCPGCGVVETVRSKDDRPGTIAPGAMAIGIGTSANAGAAPDRLAYVVTVRLRDGSTASFETGNPRSWRPGQRVNVIAPLKVAER